MDVIDQAIQTINGQLPLFWNVVFGCPEAARRMLYQQPDDHNLDELERCIHHYPVIARHAGWQNREPLHLALSLSLYRSTQPKQFWLGEQDCVRAALLFLDYIATPAYGETVAAMCGRIALEGDYTCDT
ncbi:hypothetical protein [Spirochaeta africana]|uniref:Uncharacterized protein n=1 Tax=Spirochaeta africana (strain ATCC 700263 / DSM 8902 / Z-7692) TaxID=889378 RepID=H9UHG1_SPIAZ|nr:hypothetical protein [Spirochaeta africana]AFG36954.1 hypothetical protein Spiaf_0863 [Spirochaeta africana DSM 8902]